ncbi:T9SS C-terminal target domain-containing protein [Rufibacter immobilis]|uniref:T9SS C-terminal target domain-containing protein n=1 Tax=Rufibacter immobilis TaxID=1348778 RepID=A0A3M9MZ08_9BACT|nr:glycosyl hydrolase [Rufibacter immobilis]RNI29998.1 T9SS C-terminal target domain-containing protein [Rufibacter immobilis]
MKTCVRFSSATLRLLLRTGFVLLVGFLRVTGARAADIKLEAEMATLTGLTTATQTAGYSGTGYVQGFDNSFGKNVSFTVNAPTAGLYDLAIRYATPSGEKGYVLEVNGQQSAGMFSEVKTFTTLQAGKVQLKAGGNTLKIGGGWGYYLIDFINLSPATIAPPTKPSAVLTDPNATSSTQNLFSYLTDLYGTKVLAGQQENDKLDEIAYVRTHTGKEPAVGSFDLIEYSPSRVEHGAQPNGFSEKAIAWAKKDQGRGIMSLMWHWNAPSGLINQTPDKLWWSGFYTRATTFDLAAALADKNGANYQLLLRDMDVIAAELKKFQTQDIPVLWRPLHEAAGGWFWWGAKGAGPFKELWQIMHDRFTRHHQLHHLIWVYTAESNKPDWYPGDAYVDIVGIDIYENTPLASPLSNQWTELQGLFNGNKLVTLSETGNLPNPDYITAYGTWWSWFAVWTGSDYLRKQSTSLLHSVFNHPDVITLDELPNWRTYRSVTGSALEENIGQLTVYPNPAVDGQLHIRLQAKNKVAATFTLTSSTGTEVLHLAQSLKGGQNLVQLPLAHLPAGLYLLSIWKGHDQISRKIVIQ